MTIKQILNAFQPSHFIVRLHHEHNGGTTYLFESSDEMNEFINEQFENVKEVVSLVAL